MWTFPSANSTRPRGTYLHTATEMPAKVVCSSLCGSPSKARTSLDDIPDLICAQHFLRFTTHSPAAPTPPKPRITSKYGSMKDSSTQVIFRSPSDRLENRLDLRTRPQHREPRDRRSSRFSWMSSVRGSIVEAFRRDFPGGHSPRRPWAVSMILSFLQSLSTIFGFRQGWGLACHRAVILPEIWSCGLWPDGQGPGLPGGSGECRNASRL